MCMAPFVPCLVCGSHISSMLITHTVISFHSCWHLNTKGSFKTQRHDNCMHILPLLLRGVLFWLFVSPYQVYVLTRSTAGSRALKDKLLGGIYRLVFQCAPPFLRPGTMVRDCSWYHRTPVSSEAAKRCLQVSLYWIQKLNPQHRDGGYKRALHLALQMWSP